jgi:hypothetical protein
MACKRPGVRVPLAPLHFKGIMSNTEPVVVIAVGGTARGRRYQCPRIGSLAQNRPDGRRCTSPMLSFRAGWDAGPCERPALGRIFLVWRIRELS